jgi:transposase
MVEFEEIFLPYMTTGRGQTLFEALAERHLPLHRQSVIYAREGVELERSTLAGWVGQMAALLTPLSEAIASHVRDGRALHADDSLRVL